MATSFAALEAGAMVAHVSAGDDSEFATFIIGVENEISPKTLCEAADFNGRYPAHMPTGFHRRHRILFIWLMLSR